MINWPMNRGVRRRIRSVAGSDQLADSVILEHFFRFVGVNCVEFFRAVGAGVDENAVGAAGMILEEAGAVVDMAVDDDPSGLIGVVGFDIGH